MRQFSITVNGVAYAVEVEEVYNDGADQVKAPKQPAPAPKAPVKAAQPKTVAAGETVKAPMPGTILEIKVSEGEKVKNGQVLMLLEAMKMENEIVSPMEGEIVQILTAKGASVNSGDVLCVLK